MADDRPFGYVEGPRITDAQIDTIREMLRPLFPTVPLDGFIIVAVSANEETCIAGDTNDERGVTKINLLERALRTIAFEMCVAEKEKR